MRIGYDAKRIFQNFTGLGNYSRTLVANLKQQYFHDAHFILFAPKIVCKPRTFDFCDYEVHYPKAYSKIGWRSFGINRDIKKFKIDVFHGLSAELPFGISIPSVVTIHDLIFETHPHQYSFFDRTLYSAKAKYACKTADKIIAISEATKQDIIRFYHTPEEKIEVIYQTCDDQFFAPVSQEAVDEVTKKYDLPSEYLLYVGSVIERKNLLETVKAVKQLGETCPPLVAVGNTDSAYGQQVIQYVTENKLEKKVLFLSAEFSDFAAIYKGATLFLYPSEYEGFGIPIIEAQAVGTPVITSAFSCLPEAAGQHSVLLNDLTAKAIAEAIKALIINPEKREEMASKGKQYVQQFHKDVVNEQLFSLYKNLLS